MINFSEVRRGEASPQSSVWQLAHALAAHLSRGTRIARGCTLNTNLSLMKTFFFRFPFFLELSTAEKFPSRDHHLKITIYPNRHRGGQFVLTCSIIVEQTNFWSACPPKKKTPRNSERWRRLVAPTKLWWIFDWLTHAPCQEGGTHLVKISPRQSRLNWLQTGGPEGWFACGDSRLQPSSAGGGGIIVRRHAWPQLLLN